MDIDARSKRLLNAPLTAQPDLRAGTSIAQHCAMQGRPNLFYFRLVGGNQQGPVTIDQLQQLIFERKLTPLAQVREHDCLIWRYADQFPVLTQYFPMANKCKAGDLARKPLAELTVAELPVLIEPYVRTGTTILFFLIYTPTTLAIVFNSALCLISVRSAHEFASNLGIQFPRIAPLWLVLAVTGCLGALCLGPLAAWLAYARRRIKWARFLVAATATYGVPIAILAALTLIFHQIQITLWTGGARNLSPLFR